MPAPTDAELRAAIKQHLGRLLGPPGETFVVSGNPTRGARVQKVEIPFFLPEQHVKHAVFATIGASAYEMEDGGRVESMFLSAKTPEAAKFDPIHKMLASFATYAENHRRVLDMGDVIPAKEMLAPIAAAFDAVMLVPPVPVSAELAHLELQSGVKIDFAWLLPLTAKEAAYALAHGADVLMALFALERVDPTDLERRPLDTSRRIPDLATIHALLEQEEKKAKAATFKSEERGDVIAITRRGNRGKPKS